MSRHGRTREYGHQWVSAADRRKEGNYPYALQRCLELEAAFLILRATGISREDFALREWVARYSPSRLHGFVGAHLKQYPHRRNIS